MISKRANLAVAALMALTAFAIGQAVEGAGVPFLVVATTLWVAWSARRRDTRALP